MTTVPSENILKLRILSDEICSRQNNDGYKEIVLNLKNILDSGKKEIISLKTIKTKMKCYENMCVNITNILDNIKIN
jgi:hypothetical protein